MKYEKQNTFFLPLEILGQALAINEEYTKEYDSESLFDYIDDEKLILNPDCFSYVETAFYWFMLLFSLSFLFWGIYEGLLETIACYIFILISFWLSINTILKYRSRITFDRKNGTITYPKSYLAIYKTIPFGKAQFYKTPAGLEFPLSQIRLNKSWITFNLDNAFYYNYIWYMDKNRPLPPGTAFDKYRQRDYERRKSENFPAPLYDSYVDTPDIGEVVNRYNKYTIDRPSYMEIYKFRY